MSKATSENVNENLPAVRSNVELVDVSVTVDKDDVAVIMLSKIESYCKEKIEACQKLVAKCADELLELRKDIDKKVQAVAEAHFKKTIEQFKKVLTGMKCKKITHEVLGDSCADDTLRAQLSIDGNSPDTSVGITCYIKRTAEIKTADKKVDELEKQIAEVKKEWLDWRRKLADLPSAERRARAIIAEERLSRSAEGQKLVQMLSGNMEDTIKRLGVS